jgi:8-oxo-dGTP pyrophosphatase MutT (NUDIX family)
VTVNEDGRVLVGERRDYRGAWQFPQGGIEDGEEPQDAVLREIDEETGIARRDLKLVARHPAWLCYELPTRMRSAKTGLGQAQRWFLFRLKSRRFALMPKPHPEFRRYGSGYPSIPPCGAQWLSNGRCIAACATISPRAFDAKGRSFLCRFADTGHMERKVSHGPSAALAPQSRMAP